MQIISFWTYFSPFEKGGGVLMSIILPNLNHSFVPVPVPDSGSGSVSGFLVFHTPSCYARVHQ